ncbi:N-acetylmuramoyl-L-alanine amidase [Pelagibius sp. Alg239-R121]|uniref:N-acetylmuramoyl-L-alanine amidase n=1 Tax=Pelagibius sp. Alg239-R121 TaxID=2993448 RepID=UPI0024A6F4B2|nr:N-acetylmuramoyl-L-alanine amidase [Pelagibius sp. Alg239-R121]
MKIVVLILAVMALWLNEAYAKPNVSVIRIGEHPDKTRLVLELSEAPNYRVFLLPNPYRVVIDLPELDWTVPENRIPDGRGVIEALRFGLFAAGTSRVVLDLKQPALVKSVFVLPPKDGRPHRLVVDVEPVSVAAFNAAPQDRLAVSSKQPLRVAQPAIPADVAPKAAGDARPTIVIDPGHGGVDPGSTSVTGLVEKKLALDYAKELKRQLEASGRFRVVLTRDRDVFLALRDRIEIAHQAKGNLFVSLHANNHKSRKIKGFSVYTLSEKSSDAEARNLATKENKADIIAGFDLSEQTEVVRDILIDLAQRESKNQGNQFATTVIDEVGQVAGLLGNPHRYAGFAVLKSPTIPSVLIEIGYLSNKTEEKRLRDPGYRKKLMSALARSIGSYFEENQTFNRY